MTMTPMTDEELSEIGKREKAATPGPWPRTTLMVRPGFTGRASAYALSVGAPDERGYPDAEFAAHARTDVPRLLAEVRALRAALASAFDAGFDSGWNVTGEGFNAEYARATFTAEKYEAMRAEERAKFAALADELAAKNRSER